MRIRALTLATILTGGLWLACGDDYSDGEARPLVGDTGGGCFPDGTCKVGLTCLSSLCVQAPDASSPSAPNDASDGARDATAIPLDAGQPSDCPVPVRPALEPNTVPCSEDLACEGAELCCPSSDDPAMWRCAANRALCGSDIESVECDTPDDCSDGQVCCITTSGPAPRGCPGVVAVRAECVDSTSSCARSDQLVGCSTSADCASGDCGSTMVWLSRSETVLPVKSCRPR